jgi:eukaryotic-like serine/threonine-protein kinase
MIGTKLAHYEITSHLGSGGMGDVYQATDCKLGRGVAVKFLPEVFARDADRVARFEREARVLASLNHPNIAAIYGLEHAEGKNFLVMELVTGETLAERIARGPIPLDEALPIARQITEALEAAHERGIIHRDLKPANIKVTEDGKVKVLDFGLAKAYQEDASNPNASNSPTMVSMAATNAGVILGTAGYMAPEQARGKLVTKSADIWAFGVIFHEMLTGQRTFEGDDITITLAAVVMKDPDLTLLPRRVRRLLKRCLEKDPKKRLHDIADVWYLDDENAGPAVPPPVVRRSKLWPAVSAALLLALLAGSVWTFYPRPATPGAGAIRFTIAPPDGATLTSINQAASQLAVSPDGRYLAFVADEPGGKRTIWVRALGSLSAQRLDKSEGANLPFWSPDSQHIAFFADKKLKRIPVSGGSPVDIADDAIGDGGAWLQDSNGEEVIVFTPSITSALQRVPAAGGVPTPFTKLAEGEVAHIFPQFIPDARGGPAGKRVLYFVRGGSNPGIYVQALGSQERTFVLNTPGRAVFAPPNFLLFLSENTLMAQRLDLSTLKVAGEPAAVTPAVRSGGTNGRNAFSVSSNGVLAYRSDTNGPQRQLTWYSRDGKSTGIALPPGTFGAIELSPDDKRVVVQRGIGAEVDLWLLELATGVFSRLTSSAGQDKDPVWSPDSRRIAFANIKPLVGEIRQMVVGSGKETVVLADGKIRRLADWTHDGNQLVLLTGNTVSVIPAPEEGSVIPADVKPQVLLDTRFGKNQFRVSPDGKWVAYTSNDSGMFEVNVAAFPSFTSQRQISTGGGLEPLWRADGKELFFKQSTNLGTNLAAVEVKPGATFETGPTRTLFPVALRNLESDYYYSVTRDGQRFLVEEPPKTVNNTVEQLYVIANWPALVK